MIRPAAAIAFAVALFGADSAHAQAQCEMTSANLPSLSVVRGSTNNIVYDGRVQSQIDAVQAAGCAGTDAQVAAMNVERQNPTSYQTATLPYTITLATGGSFTITNFAGAAPGGGAARVITYTPPSSGSSERISSAAAVTTGALHRFYTNGQAVNVYVGMTVTIVSPDAPTSAVTSVTPSTIGAGGTSTVVVTLTNPNSGAVLNGVADTITLPGGVTLASAPTASQCSGTVTGTSGGSSVALTGGSLTAGGTCTITFSVTSSTAATHTIPAGTPSATGANAGSAGTSGTLTVLSPPTISSISRSYGQAGTTQSAITVDGTGFNTTAGNNTVSFGGTNVTASSVNGAGTQLTVTPPNKTAGANTITVTNSATGTSSAFSSYTYLDPPTISAAFGTSPITTAGSTTLTVTITNPGSNSASINGVAMASGSLSGLSAGSPATNTCGGTLGLNGGNLSLTGGTATLAAGSSCTFSVTVTSSTASTYNFTPGIVSATSPISLTGVAGSQVSLQVVAPPNLTVALGSSGTPTQGQNFNLTATVGNNGSTVTSGNITLTSTLPAGLTYGGSNAGANWDCSASAGASLSCTFSGTIAAAGSNNALSVAIAVAGGSPTSHTISATAAGGGAGNTPSASTSITVGQIPDNFASVTGGSQSTLVNTAFGTTFSVTVRDAANTVIEGASVTFTAPAGGASGTFAGTGTNTQTVTTDASGVATASTFTANGTIGTYSVDVSAAKNSVTSTTSIASVQNINPPTVTGLNPTSGSTAGGTTVVITGTNFFNVNAAGAVKFGGVNATSHVRDSATQITAVAPAGTGTVNVTVTSLTNGTSATGAANQYTYADPQLTINDVTLAEGNSGTTTFTFTVGLSAPAGAGGVTFDIATANGTAVAPGDYTAKSLSSQTIPQGSSSYTFDVLVNGDTAVEADETFFVNVTNATGATVSDGQGQGTITNDDAAPTITSFTYGSIVAYNTGSATATTIDATAGGVTGSPTSYTVSNASGGTYGTSSATSGGGTVSIDSSGSASYTPLAGYRGNDTFFVIATNGAGSSSPATVTVSVGNPTLAANVTGTGAKQGEALSGYVLTLDGGRANYSCSSANAPAGITVGAGGTGSTCTLTGTPASSGALAFNVDVTDSSVTGANGGTASPFTQNNIAVTLNVGQLTAPTSAVTSVSPSPAAPGQSSTVTVTLTNTNVSSALSGVGLTINLPANLTLASAPSAAQCGGTVSGTSGGGTVTLTGGSIAAGTSSTCALTFAVSATVTGTYSIPAGTPSATGASAGTPGTAGSLTVAALPPTLTMSFSPSSIAQGGTSAIRFDIANPNAGTALTGIAFTNTFPAGLTHGINTTTTAFCGGATIVLTAPNQLSFSNATLAANGSCNFSFNVTGATAGAKVNTTSAITSNETAAGSAATATLNVGLLAPTSAVTGVAPSTMTVGQASGVTVRITNPNGSTALANVADTITLPANLTLASVPTGSQCGGTVSGTLGGSTVALTGGSIGAGANCTIDFTVTSNTAATYTIPAGTPSADSAVAGTAGTAGSLTVQPLAPTSAASVAPATITAGGSTTLTITLINPNGGTALAGVADSVDLSGLSLSAASVGANTCGGTLLASPTALTLSNGSLTAGGTCSFAASLTVPSASGSPYTIGAGTPSATGAAAGVAGTGTTLTVNPPSPTVTSLSPTSGPTSSGTTVVLTGTNLTGATAVSFGGNPATSFTVDSATQITATAPAGSAGTVNVTVTTPSGTSATGAGNQYTYIAAPTVTSLAPASGPTSGSTSVTITGTGFTGATAVAFGATGATSFTVDSATQITATSPAGVAGTVNVTVTTTGGTSATGAGSQFTYVAAPSVTAVSPDSGPTAGGNTVVITGANFSGATAVSFGANPASGVTVDSPTQITATAPAGSAGTVNVRVTTAGGTSATAPANFYTYVAAPSVTSVAPTAGSTAGGTVVTITGTNFASASAVTFGGTAATSYTINSATQITATAPAGSGTVDIRVTSPGGTSAAGAGDQFTYVAAPTLASLSPASGVETGGTVVTLTGTNFTPASVVNFGAATPAVTFVSATQLTVAAPAGTGTVNVTVTTVGGTSGPQSFSYVPALTTTQAVATVTAAFNTPLTPVAPVTASGGAAPISFAISGAALPSWATFNTSTGQLSGTPDAVLSPTVYTVTATDSTAGTAQTSSKTFTLSVGKGDQTITFTSTAPTSAAVGGASYTVTATASSNLGVTFTLDGTSTGCSLAGGTVSFTSTGTCVINANQTGDSNWNAAPQAQQSFAVGAAQAMTVSLDYSPASLAVGAQGTLTITFTNPNVASSPAFSSALHSNNVVFARLPGLGGTCGVTPGNTSIPTTAQVNFNNITIPSGTCTVTLPYRAASAGTANWTFDGFTPTGWPATALATSNTVAAIPSVSTVSPNSGPVSQAVTITGTGFSTTLANNTVNFGAGTGTVTAATATQLTVTAPASGSGAVNVTVTVNGQTSATGPTFTFLAPPIAADKPGVAVPYDSAGTAIDLSGSITGGAHSSIAIGTAPAHGTTSIAGDVVTYTPTAGYFGADSFTYTATGPGGTSNVATVSLTVATPAAPVAADKPGVAVAYNSAGTAIDLSASITGVHSSIAIGTAPAHGTTSIAGDVVTYTPTAGYYGADSFTYTATGPGGTSNVATVSLTVATPAAPVAADKPGVAVAYNSAGTAIDLSSSITGVHSSIAIGTAPAHGTTSIAGDVVTYTPTAGYFGADSFTYTATGPGGTSNIATVSLTVATPAAPVAADKPGVAVAYNSAGTAIDLSGSITGVHSSIAIGTAPAHGTTSIAGDVVTYTPTAGYYGADSFTYTATGPGGTSNVATVSLTVATPAAPVAADKPGVAVAYNSAGTAIDLTASITGVHSSIAIGTAPAHGTTSIAGDVVTYTPTAGYYGADSFTYTATGPGGTSNVATVSLTVATPAAPVAANKSGVAVAYNSAGTAIDLSGSITGVHSSIAIGTAPAHGTTSIAGDVVTYTPTAGYYGADSFTYTATGPGGTSNVATVSLTVATPAAPVAANKSGVAVAYNSAGTAIDLSGSITGVHSSIAIGTAPAHGTTSIAGDVVTYTPTAGYYGADSFTYTATGPGGTSNVATVSLTVATPAAPVAADKPGVAVAYNSAGTAIDLTASITGVHSSIAIGTAPAHGTTSIAGDVVTYTPTAGYYGADSFTYTATGPGGTSNVATVSLTVATPAAPVAANKSGVAVAYNSAGTAIDLSGSITGVHSSIAIGTAPAHGTTSIAGDVVTYTPTAGYYGADSFTYTATGPGGTSNVATVSLTVATPAAPVAANKSGVAVAYNSAGTAIDLSGSITGVHSSIAIGTAPAHGTTSIAGDVVTYTPTAGYYGADSFTYTATGPGGTSNVATVSLTVATPAAPVAADKPGVAVAYNSAGTAIDLSGSITGVHSSIAIGTAPAHGTVTVSGDVVTYTPATGYYGADSFTYTATGPGGTSNVATVGVSVANPPAPTSLPGTGSVAGSASVSSTNSVSIDLSALVTGEYDSISIDTPPAHGTVTLSVTGGQSPAGSQSARAVGRTIATYRPNTGFVGTDTFTFYATGPGGRSASAAVTITVVGSVPVAQAKTAATGDGQTVTVDLTAGATEGPFTGAAVVTVSPANSATTRIVDSGTGAARTFRLEVTPNARYSGNVTVTYTLTNAYGTSAPATVTVAVTARPNPTADPNVVAISDAQAETARRFARSQVANFMRRTEQLHNGGGQSDPVGVTLNSRDGRGYVRSSPAFDASALEITERMRPSANDPMLGRVANFRDSRAERADMLGSMGSMTGYGDPSATTSRRSGAVAGAARAVERPVLSEDSEEGGSGERRTGSVAIWSGGAIDIGTRDATTRRTKITATTSGLSAGMDIKLADSVVAGIGGGYGNDVSHIGGTAARVRGTSSLFAAYASVSPGNSAFIDGMVGIGDLSFSTRRTVATLNVNAIGSRDGRYTVGALAAGLDKQDGTVRWSVYGRGEYMNATLSAYTESGAGRYNLRFDERSVRSLTGTLGGRIEFTGETGFATVTPRLRAEWNHEFADADAQLLDYADIPGLATFSMGTAGWTRDQYQVSAGARFVFPRGWSFDAELGLRGGSGEKAGTLRLQLSKEF